MEKIRIGVSKCLVGAPVRYDGGHARDRYVTETLGQYVKFIPVCPEMEAGFGVPREPIRLVGNPASPRLITVKTNKDVTDTMMTWAKRRVRELEKEDFCGFIFKSKSPSSGMERVKVYTEKGIPVKKGVGLFARAFMEHFPLIPVEEEGRLYDFRLRENFIERIFILNRWQQTRERKKSLGGLVAFHTGHKLQILAHSEEHYRKMGELLAETEWKNNPGVYTHYEILLLEALRLKATVKKHSDLLQYMMGYFTKQLTADEAQELLKVNHDFYIGLVPLIAPVTLLRHYVEKYGQPCLKNQSYLLPYPTELILQNRA